MRTFTSQKPEDMFIMLLNLPIAKILSSKIPRFDGIFIIRPSHPDGLKKADLGEKKTTMGALIVASACEWIGNVTQ